MRAYMLSLLTVLLSASATHAGSVSAFISGGHLYLYGDSQGSSLVVDSPSAGTIRVTGTVNSNGENTVVNGQVNGTVSLSGWTRGIYNFSYAGRDSISLVALKINGPAHIDLGEGDDALTIGDAALQNLLGGVGAALPVASSSTASTTISQSLLVIGVGGNDQVLLSNLFVGGAATIDVGSGEDDVFVGTPGMSNSSAASVMFYESCTIIPGTDADQVSLTSTDVRRNLVVDDSLAALQLDITDVHVDGSTFIYGTSANDRIVAASFSVANLLKVISEGGDDFVSISGDTSSTEVFPGTGNDSIRLNSLMTDRSSVYLDPGNDDLQIQGGDYGSFYGFGSSGNDLFRIQNARIGQAYLYGEGGTDTYQDGGGNSIGKLNLYTIENQ